MREVSAELRTSALPSSFGSTLKAMCCSVPDNVLHDTFLQQFVILQRRKAASTHNITSALFDSKDGIVPLNRFMSKLCCVSDAAELLTVPESRALLKINLHRSIQSQVRAGEQTLQRDDVFSDVSDA